jgi:hypothetical protein
MVDTVEAVELTDVLTPPRDVLTPVMEVLTPASDVLTAVSDVETPGYIVVDRVLSALLICA